MLNVDLGGGVITEGGAEFIGPTQDRIAALAKDVGVDTFPTYNTGDNIYFRNGMATRYSSSGPLGPVPPDPTGAVEAEKAILQLDDMAKTIPLDAPWTAPRAKEWDSQTFETWKLANVLTPVGPLPARRRHHLDLLVRAARRLAALRPLLPRRGRQRVQPRATSSGWSTPAAARRSAASSAARSSCRSSSPSASATASCSASRAPDRHRERHGDRGRRRLQRDRPARHRRGAAAAGGAHRLQPAAARAARPAHPAHADGHGDEGPRRLPRAVLARRRPHRPGRGRHAARAGDLRQHAALGQARASSWPSSRPRPRASAWAPRATTCAATC